jgi:hypothetical protein
MPARVTVSGYNHRCSTTAALRETLPARHYELQAGREAKLDTTPICPAGHTVVPNNTGTALPELQRCCEDTDLDESDTR